MKTKLTLGALALVGTLTLPAFAATTSSSLVIHDNNVNIINAEVTGVSGNIINAITRFKDLVSTWTLTTNASTSIMTTSKVATSTGNIHVGDKINVSGSLTSLGGTLSLTADKILDITQAQSVRVMTGTVSNINTSNGTFLLTKDDKTLTVETNTGTQFRLLSQSTTTPTLSLLSNNIKVVVTGMLSSDGNTLTATSVIGANVKMPKATENNGIFHGLKNGWKEKEDRDNNGEHKGFFNFNFGLFKK